jgi:hypothetical protein
VSKFNTGTVRPATHSPIITVEKVSGRTHEGGPGYARDTKSELFLLAVHNMVGEDTFYERGGQRDDRFTQLIRLATVEDPEWTAQLLSWLRGPGNMRTASIVGAAEYTAQSLANNVPGSRQVIASVLQRADEPGELLAYWTSRYGRKLPMPLKRGIGDAVIRMGNEMSYLKWDSEGRGFRFADVLNLTHPGDRRGSRQEIKGQWQHDLFEYITSLPYRPEVEIPDSLATLTRRKALMAMPVNERRDALEPVRLRLAGMTWESLAGWLQGPMDAKAWEAIIPNMGYMALLRNLRNFDQAGVSDEVAAQVSNKLADSAEVARSRQLPMRFLSAYRAAPSLRWSWALERALQLCLQNVPTLRGRTLVLVDRSGSMESSLSARSDLTRADAAAIFGTCLAMRSGGDLVEFGTGSQLVRYRAGESVLPVLQRFHSMGGTYTQAAVQKWYAAHDRVVIVTDEQAASYGYYGGDPGQVLPQHVPMYTWNLAGYQMGHAPSGSGQRHTFGGLSDQAFRMIPLLEAGRDATWPWIGAAA